MGSPVTHMQKLEAAEALAKAEKAARDAAHRETPSVRADNLPTGHVASITGADLGRPLTWAEQCNSRFD